MDPQACLERAREVYINHDWDELEQALDAYWEWRVGGGFEPHGGDVLANWLGDATTDHAADDLYDVEVAS